MSATQTTSVTSSVPPPPIRISPGKPSRLPIYRQQPHTANKGEEESKNQHETVGSEVSGAPSIQATTTRSQTKPSSSKSSGINVKRATWNGTINKPTIPVAKPIQLSNTSIASSNSSTIPPRVPKVRAPLIQTTVTSSTSTATATSSTTSPGLTPSASSTSISTRHANYLASIVAQREAKLKEERRKKPGVKERLTSTFTLSQQVHRAGGGQTTVDRLAREKDAEYTSLLPKVFSMLGGSSIDVLRNEFKSRGWIENENEWSGVFSIQWSIVGRVINYSTLQPHQLVNHFPRAHAITSKSGLCKNIHSVRLNDADVNEFFPRCFPLHIHDAEDLNDFRYQFRINATLNIVGRFLRCWRKQQNLGPSSDSSGLDEPLPLSSFSEPILTLCLIAIQEYLRKLSWIKDGLDNNYIVLPAKQDDIEHADGMATKQWSSLTEIEWTQIESLAETFENTERDQNLEKMKLNPPSTTSDATAPSVSSAAAVDDEQKEQEEDEAEEVELETQQDAEASSPTSSPIPSPINVPAEDDEREEEEVNLDNLNLFSRTPLPFPTLYTHFESLYAILLVKDPQSFSLTSPHSAVHNLWIIKPGGLSRGRGIEILNSYGRILAILKGGGKWVCQKYIERPLVVFKKKFDIRQWVLVTNFNQVYSVYFYTANCYFRFSSSDYSLYSFDSFIHLTNNSIQKYCPEFDQLGFAEGNMWSSVEFIKYLDSIRDELAANNPSFSSYLTGQDLWTQRIQPQMKRIAALTIGASQEVMDLRPNSFSLFGFDYMISSDLKPWLIEVNSSPTLVGISIPNLVESMSKDLLTIVLEDEWSPCSDTYRAKIQLERERLAAIAAALAEEESKEVEKEKSFTTSSKRAAVGVAVKSTLDQKRTHSRSNSSGHNLATTSANSAKSTTTATDTDPFLLPSPHPVGHRVGGFEVIESSFIGSIPKSHRQPIIKSVSTNPDAVNGAPSPASSDIGKKSEKTKPTAAQPTGLFVTGKLIPNPAAVVILPKKLVANKSSTAGRK